MTLSNLSDDVKLVVKWGLAALALLFLIWIIWIAINSLFGLAFRPTGEDIAYGKLAPPTFTKTYHKVASKNFTLETNLPKTDSEPKAKVFKVVGSEGLSEKEQNKIVKDFGLLSAKKTSSGSVSTWKHTNGSKLVLNTDLRHVTYRFDYSKDPSVLSGTIKSSEKDLLKKAELTLKSFDMLPKDIDKNKASVRFLSIKKGTKKSSSKEKSNGVEISYFRKIDGTLSTGTPPIKILFSQNGDRILEFDYLYLPINPAGSPYPIIGAQQAWESLKGGLAYSEKKTNYNAIKLKAIKLAHWESQFRQPYVQPVWVYSLEGVSKEGNREFAAYLPAIDPSFLKSGE